MDATSCQGKTYAIRYAQEAFSWPANSALVVVRLLYGIALLVVTQKCMQKMQGVGGQRWVCRLLEDISAHR